VTKKKEEKKWWCSGCGYYKHERELAVVVRPRAGEPNGLMCLKCFKELLDELDGGC